MNSDALPPTAARQSRGSSSRLDEWLAAAGRALRTLAAANPAGRPMPEPLSGKDTILTDPERRHAAALMRVNHVGEVCAQALYEGQALMARTPALASELRAAAAEEEDHLAWCMQRLRALGDRRSWLNPLWFGGAFALGAVAGRLGDPWSLGFVEETERQVEAHLASHLDKLPATDHASRAVVEQMKADEARHAAWANSRGATKLPWPARTAMRAAAKVMTATAYRI